MVGHAAKVSDIFSDILGDIINEVHGNDYLSDDDETVDVMISNSDGEEVPVSTETFISLQRY